MEAIACDVLVIGSGAAGLTTAITAHHFGADVLVVAHPEIGFVASLLPLHFIPPCAKKVPEKRASAHGNRAPDGLFHVPSTVPAFEAGQFEVDGVCASPGAFEMKTFFKVIIWIAALFFGLFVWNVLPDFRPLVSSILAAAFACYVLSVIVEGTVKRVISDEQLELRSRLELLDRKVTAILRDALEQRRLR
jgi:hypothetical protein